MLDFDNVKADMILTRYDIKMESQEKPEAIAARMLPKDPLLKKVAEDVLNLKGKLIEDDVRAALKENSPEDVIEGGLLKGMDVVSELYGRGIYYLPHVMVASDAMDKGMKVAEGALKGGAKKKGTIVMHAAEGDPHDIGKNIAAVLLKSNGFGVVDLGRDVLVGDVVAAVEKNKPQMVTGTALMTTTMMVIGSRRDTSGSIQELREFALGLDTDLAIFAVLTPLPGTEVNEVAAQSGWIEDSNYSHYDMVHAIMPTETLTRQEVQEELYQCYRSFFGSPMNALRGMFSSNEIKKRCYRHLAGKRVLGTLRQLV